MQIWCGGKFTLRSVARDGVCVTYNSSTGNAITGDSVTDGRCITLSRDCFTKAYNNNDNCVQYASKADAYSGGGVGSDTRGVYIDSATGEPKEMQFTLGKSVPSNTCLFTGLGTGLKKESDGALCLDFTNTISCTSGLPVTAKAVYEFVTQKLSNRS